jgi:hypothetical protein
VFFWEFNVRKMKSSTRCIGIVMAALWAAVEATAQPWAGDAAPSFPPREALAACKDLKAGQDCSFTVKNEAVKGSCWAPGDMPLACKPKSAPTGDAMPPK